MKSLQEFLQNFLNKKGQYVFFSLLIAKICAFLGALFLIRILPESEFGTMSIVASVFAVFAPFSGFGSSQILLRYGSVTGDLEEKETLTKYLFFQGFGYQVILGLLFLAVSFFYVNRYEDILIIFLCFAIRLIGYYYLNHIQSIFRIFNQNAKFGLVNNVVNISGLVLLLLLSYFFGLRGYLFAIAITPFFALIWYKRNDFIKSTENFSFGKKELWNYGFHAAGTALLSDMLFSADILLLSFLMDESAVANYKVAILIPANITFLAVTFMQNDFPELAKNYKNKSFIINYISNYYKIFIPISVLVLVVGYLGRNEILHFFFSEKYSNNGFIFAILLLGFCLNMLLRNLYGNLLSAVGKMKLNTLVSLLTLLFLLVSSFILVKSFGILGMAISMTLSMFLSGLLLFFFFKLYLKKLK